MFKQIFKGPRDSYLLNVRKFIQERALSMLSLLEFKWFDQPFFFPRDHFLCGRKIEIDQEEIDKTTPANPTPFGAINFSIWFTSVKPANALLFPKHFYDFLLRFFMFRFMTGEISVRKRERNTELYFYSMRFFTTLQSRLSLWGFMKKAPLILPP